MVAGLVVFAFACWSFAHPVVRKIGAVAILVASFAGAYFIFDSVYAGIGAILAWFFLPWIQLLTRVRTLRLPLEKKLRHRVPPGRDRFPMLTDLTEEIENAGFEYVDDSGCEWGSIEQFFRIFYHQGTKTQAAICMSEQDNISFTHVTITSRDRNGQIWRTWNYPFSMTMQFAPELHVKQVESAYSFEDLLEHHEQHLLAHGVAESDLIYDEPESINSLMEMELSNQIKHNLSTGLIVPSGPDTFRYSYRGLIFLWAQFLKDMVKLS